MIDVDTLPQAEVELNEEAIDYGSALAHVVSAASILKGLGEFDDEAKEIVLRYFDMWIDTVKPIMYMQGLAEVLGDRIRGSLADIFNSITEDELADLLSSMARLKAEPNPDVNDVKELLYYTSRFLEGLGVSLYDVREFINMNDPRLTIEGLVAVVSVALGIVLMRG